VSALILTAAVAGGAIGFALLVFFTTGPGGDIHWPPHRPQRHPSPQADDAEVKR
jgi:hypothetical protein